MSCRDVSRQYMQCRMDKNLMAPEEMDKLGFHEDDAKRAEERRDAVARKEAERHSGHRKEDEGFNVVKESLLDEKRWRRPSMLGGGSWSFKRKYEE